MSNKNRNNYNKHKNFNRPSKKINYTESDKKFVNPYNFIPIDFKSKSKGNLDSAERISGYLECILETKSPIAIPDIETKKEEIIKRYNNKTKKEEEEKHPIYEPTKVNGEYTILGSSIRGMIRNVYETITDSCFSTAKENIITRRNSQALKPCVLIKDKDDVWKIYECKRYVFAVDKDGYTRFTFHNVKTLSKEELDNYKDKTLVAFKSYGDSYRKNGYKVGEYVKDFREIKDVSEVKTDEKIGYLNIGEIINKKHFESIFEIVREIKINQNVIDQEIIKKAIKQLKEIHEIYNDESINKKISSKEKENKESKKEFYPRFNNQLKNGVVTCWYIIENNKDLKLSLASIGRVAYTKNMKNLLDKKYSCETRDDLCKACALFGMAKDNNGVGSKVRITDAKANKEIKLYQDGKLVILPELAGPKISYIPFYLRNKNNNQNVSNWSYDSNEFEIRGRKYYWHHDFKNPENKDKNKRNSSMSLIDTGNEFIFRVYFDNIDSKQLNELKWAITFGNNNNNDLCHKIGHGKPLGLGSARINITKEVIRDNDDCYKLIEKEVIDIVDIEINQNVKNSLLKIANIHTMDNKNVEYPGIDTTSINSNDYKENYLASHQWFTNNFKFGKNKAAKIVLPEISDSNNELSKLKVSEDNN